MSDSFAALVHFKQKASKWRNAAVLLAALALMLALKCLGGNQLSGSTPQSNYIAEIRINGIIFENDFRSKILEEIAKEDNIKAVIAKIDSPGGGIVGSEILFNDLRKIAEKKPLVVVMESVAASGGYMAALASDHIIAHNGTLTGSIGVLMESPEVTELAQKVGIKFNTYKSSPLKGSPSPFEKPSKEVDQVIQDSIRDSYAFFSDLVIARRGEKLKKEFKAKALDGRIFTGRQALQAGLVDEVGTKDQAIAYLKENKIDTENLAIHEVELVKNEGKILEKIFGILPSFLQNKVATNHHLMAIAP